MEPYAPQGWLEHAKLEEECGDMKRCEKIMDLGLEFCRFNESLLVKSIKHQERQGRLSEARMLLSRLRDVPIDRVWRVLLEGALLEARAGQITVARKVFKYLMQHAPRYGPIYYEACAMEILQGNFARALKLCERGV